MNMGKNKKVKSCILCKLTVDDPVKLGEFKTFGSISAHYYCLLLTSNLCQNGADNEGILGFLPKDIREEENRIKKQICYYCKKPYANIGCCATKCVRTFHLYCGVQNLAICHFQGDFRTICNKHHKAERKKCTRADQCVICCESMGAYNRVLSILAPCCKSGWLHKWCIAEFALNAGYFFKCPLCNDKETFRNKLVHKGIFVPDQDATWELEPNAFADLLVRPDECSAENCHCPRGRNYRKSIYKLITCNTCGSKCIHAPCMTTASKTFTCNECNQLLRSQQARVGTSSDLVNNNVHGEDDVDVVTVDNSKKIDYDSDTDSVDSLLMSFFDRSTVRRERRIESDETIKLENSPVLAPQGENAVNRSDEELDALQNVDVNEVFTSIRKRKRGTKDSDSSISSKRRAKSISDFDQDDFPGFTDIDENSLDRISNLSRPFHIEYAIPNDETDNSRDSLHFPNDSESENEQILRNIDHHTVALETCHKPRIVAINDLSSYPKPSIRSNRACSTYIERRDVEDHDVFGNAKQEVHKKFRARAKSQCFDIEGNAKPVTGLRRSLRIQEKIQRNNDSSGSSNGGGGSIERKVKSKKRSSHKNCKYGNEIQIVHHDAAKENRNFENYRMDIKMSHQPSARKQEVLQGGKAISINHTGSIIQKRQTYSDKYTSKNEICDYNTFSNKPVLQF